ncbi:MarR family winged helix-turn-helix transcriptional regulator [Streptomyces sp. NBC_01198]|uniref:MarR family winged helix-turn-helix transcriptional regulator n=1 Tax=Streptomyces sp. NBC_01198 TaxID=2903769 RepID=UPI002E0FC794|nr:MarR family transcriptional regulator [Streptomyces sp. NBC_01198]
MSTDDLPNRNAGPGGREAAGAAPDTVDTLVQLSFLVQGVLTGVASAHDVSLVQLRLFGILRDRTPGMRELAHHLGLDKSSMTGLVARAEKRGLVQRRPSPHDGRGVLVSLTPEGRRLTEVGAAEIAQRLAALTAPLSAEERALLRTLTAKILPA